MLRIAHVSDSHFGIPRRHDEVVRIHKWIADDLGEQASAGSSVDALVHTGDLFHGATTPATRRDAIDWLISVAHLCPVYVLLGNHEKAGELDILTRVHSRHAIVPIDSPGWFDIKGLTMLAIPWPRRGNLAGGSFLTLGEMNQAGSAALSALIQSRPVDIIAAHVQVTEARVGGGELLSPADVVLSTADLGLSGASAVMLGHIHKPQTWRFCNTRVDATVSYAGSPLPLDWGDWGERGYQVWSLDKKNVQLEFRKTPHRRMVTINIKDHWCEPEILRDMDPFGGLHPDDEVRVRYSLRTDQTTQAASWWADQSQRLEAAGCIPTGDPRIVSERREVRAEGLAEASSDHERLEVYLEHRNIWTDGHQFQRLCHKLDSLKGGEA